MNLYGVANSLGPQLMAEIGDVRRFAHKGSLTAFAGVDLGANQFGTYEAPVHDPQNEALQNSEKRSLS